MTLGGSTRRTMATALAVAYLLVLQALFGGLAAGTHAGAGFTLDAFGQVICRSTDAGRTPAPAEHRPDCCTAGCTSSSGPAAPPPAAAALAPAPFARSLRAPLPPPRPVAAAAPRSPRSTRGPPLA